jgi:hypothetical protein
VRIDGTLPVPIERLVVQLVSLNPARGLEPNPFLNVAPDGTFNFSSIAPGDFRVLFPVGGGRQPGSNAAYIQEAATMGPMY